MEELLSSFSSSLTTKKDEFNHSAYYKKQGESNTQKKRRLELLKTLKEKRASQVNESRGILHLLLAAELEETEKAKKAYEPTVFVPGFTVQKPFYANTLMLSEWMVSVPEDLQENWLMLACPKGTRVLVVASKGRTRAYSKHGYFYKEFLSLLPGSLKNSYKQESACILDCVLNDKLKLLFVLDVLAWGNISMAECDLQFREYWLKSQFEESPHFGIISESNNYSIKHVQKLECTRANISNLLQVWPLYDDNRPAVDGLLFYHKEGHYVDGYTPLVVWLFPFMVNELLGSDINVNEMYMKQKPSDYVNQQKYIEKFDSDLLEKTRKKQIATRLRSKKSFSRSTSTSFNSSITSNLSENPLVVFKFDKPMKKAKEVEDVDLSEGVMLCESGNAGNHKSMEVANSSTDSAVYLMDDSIADTSNADINTFSYISS